ncbi:unnamed protein product [Vitrella brassicaformis CCMP3155]|uniref:Electron transfer flavoprotein-ubiquinone oxidoreductase n=1 Tax=Vitrella brassicaformis (strain CCMP3155) TaxID=1169540 RepID=A0A0G4E9H8_VITBC|nr:unnamed protein product [Vitrella brassicaformis CCMP3155]|eukprot:CEL92532.1 unnamed protein product [Vitrella brassicaformis CCMP3155]
MEYDVLIVGGGPAGLAAAIRAKQVAQDRGSDISVCVIEKGAEIGSHILSGNVFEPRALNELLPDWRERGAPLDTAVTDDRFYLLTKNSAVEVPPMLLPPTIDNHGNHVISLGNLCKWMGSQAEDMGVEVFAGFSAAEGVFNDGGALVGVQTADVGIDKAGKPKDTFQPGMILKGKQTILAEGCRGSLSEALMARYALREGRSPQQYGLGVKEVWELAEDKAKPGLVVHTVGWPLDAFTYGGSFMYHMKPNLLLLGLVVGLDYRNPYLSPYQELQRFKHHPAIRPLLEGGRCISYGARCLNEGGVQALPKLTFPGGVLTGCGAGFLNVPKIKGSHTAIKSGMLAGETVAKAIIDRGEAMDEGAELAEYQTNMEGSWVWQELQQVRNAKPAFKWGGLYGGLAYSGFTLNVTGGREPWTFTWNKKDCDTTDPKDRHTPIEYPKPDGKISFDLLENLVRSGTNHEHDQPAHLKVKPPLADVPVNVSWKQYAGPESRFCPAKVYEFLPDESSSGEMRLQINAQNCVHCKCCSIKTPQEYINWTVPEGGGGPAYSGM